MGQLYALKLARKDEAEAGNCSEMAKQTLLSYIYKRIAANDGNYYRASKEFGCDYQNFYHNLSPNMNGKPTVTTLLKTIFGSGASVMVAADGEEWIGSNDIDDISICMLDSLRYFIEINEISKRDAEDTFGVPTSVIHAITTGKKGVLSISRMLDIHAKLGCNISFTVISPRQRG